MSAIPNILSQNEINELLNNLINEEAAGIGQKSLKRDVKKVKNYDFKTPKKLTKEQIKVISGVHENFARQLSSYFTAILRTYVEINVVSIEEQHYYEYNNALPDSVLIGIIEAAPIEGDILVDISNSVTYTLIERMLGGAERENNVIPQREFTEIEISLMERVFRQIGVFTKDAWSGLVEVNAALKQIETNSRLIQSISMDEIVVIVIMEVSIKNIKGTINFCIPCINIEPLVDKLGHSKYISKRTLDAIQEEIIIRALESSIKAAPLEVRAVLGETMLSLKEISNLQIGDVIRIDQEVGNDIKINIENGDAWFLGMPGTKKNKKAIKINKVIHRGGSSKDGE